MIGLALLPFFCVWFGAGCGAFAAALYWRERREAAASWHTTPEQRRRVVRDEHGNPLMYLDGPEDAL